MARKNEQLVFPSEGEAKIESKPVPEPGPEQVLVETARTLVSTGTELAKLTGAYERNTFPFAPGYSNVGEVVETGADVNNGLLGARVATTSPHARFILSDAADCQIVPDGVDGAEAAFFKIAEISMNGVRRSDLSFGESVVVYGLGLVGHLTARVCRFAGARPLIGLDVADQRRGFLPDRPGIEALDPTTESVADAVAERTDGRMADVVFEVTGNADAIPTEVASLREQGRFVVLGSPREPSTFDFYSGAHLPGYTIVGAHSSTHPSRSTPENPWTKARHAELYFNLLREDRISVRDLLTHEVPARDAPEMYARLLEDRADAIGVVFEW